MATTTNYGWTTPDDTALVKDGASAIRSLGTSVDTTTKNLNPSTTLGDIEYRSSTANTNTRLAIGTTGQVLTVAGGVPSWASPTPSGGPAFSAYKSSDQTFSANTFTKITFDTEVFDTGSAFAASAFTPQTAGYYQINYTIFLDPQGTNETVRGQLYKNGSAYLENFRFITNYGGFTSGMIVYMNGTTDYLEVYAICGNSPACKGGSTLSSFNGVWIRS